MDFKSLLYITTIAREGSISGAAQRLYISQSSLSLFLKNFEARLGTVIFKRSTHGLKLTYEGERVVDTANQILAMWDRMKSELSDMKNELCGRVRFGVSSYRSPFILPFVIKKLKESGYSGIEFAPTEAISPVLEDMLQKGTLDVSLLALPISNTSLRVRNIGREEIMICGNKEDPIFTKIHYNPERGRKWIEIRDLENQPMILVQTGQGLNKLAMNTFAKHGLIPNTIFKTTNLNTAIELVKYGMGLTLVPQLEYFYNRREDVAYASIGENGCFRDMALVYPANTYISGAVETISDMVEAIMRLDRQTFEIE